MSYNSSIEIKTKQHTKECVEESDFFSLVLYNDDFNTFDHVIQCLVSICKHETIQAQQCAYLVHYTGKSDIKQGDIIELEIYKQALQDQGLSVVIEKIN